MPYAKVNGLELFYYDDDFTPPWQPAETILLNHYGGGDSTLYNSWIPILARHYRVIRWDRPGHGRSEKPAFGYSLTPESFVADIVGFMDALGLEKVHYVADKVAGAAGIALAASHPERVDTLTFAVCFLSGKRVRQGFVDGAENVMAKGSWIAAFESQSGGKALSPSADPLQDLYYREVQSRIPAHVQAAAYRCVASSAFDVEPLLKDVQAPTLLLSPDEETPLVTRAEQELIVTTIPSCEQRILPGSTMHFPFTDGEWCAQQVLSFLQNHSSTER